MVFKVILDTNNKCSMLKILLLKMEKKKTYEIPNIYTELKMMYLIEA
jgi:hypothetical protein